MLAPDQIVAYHRNGYVVVPNVISGSEIAAIRAAGEAHARSGARNSALHAIPGLNHLWHDPRLVSVAKDILGPSITYFAEASYSRHVFVETNHTVGRHLHHDAKGTTEHLFNRRHTPSAHSYPAVRFGLYLQDYTNLSGALKVSPGSHKIDTSSFDQAKLPYVNVDSKPGDIVCFCMRTLHSALSVRLKGDPSAALSPAEEDHRLVQNPHAFFPNPPVREAVFIDFVGTDEAADLYIKNRVCQSATAIDGLADAFGADAMAAKAAAAGINLRMDGAVAEAVRKIDAHTINGIIQKAGVPYLRILPALCRHSREFSPHFSLLPNLDPSYTLKTAITLKNEIGRRLQAYTATGATKAPDSHMQETVLDQA